MFIKRYLSKDIYDIYQSLEIKNMKHSGLLNHTELNLAK